MKTGIQPQRATAFWPRLWDRLLILENAVSAPPDDLLDRRITRLENELSTVRKELATLRAQALHDVALSERDQAGD